MTEKKQSIDWKVLQLAGSLDPAEIEADYVAEQLGLGFQDAWSVMRALANAGHLKDSRLAGYRITNKGRELLAIQPPTSRDRERND